MEGHICGAATGVQGGIVGRRVTPKVCAAATGETIIVVVEGPTTCARRIEELNKTAVVGEISQFPGCRAVGKNISPGLSAEMGYSVTKFCVSPELFVMPTPLIIKNDVNEEDDSTVRVNTLAPTLNIMPLTPIGELLPRSSTLTSVVFETSNVAVSVGPLGMVSGIQFVGNAKPSQMLLVGSRSHVALPQKAVAEAKRRSSIAGPTVSERKMQRCHRRHRLIGVLRDEVVSVS